VSKQQKARAKRERRAERGPGFSSYAPRKLQQLIEDEAAIIKAAEAAKAEEAEKETSDE
jgi:hypothetical protein